MAQLGFFGPANRHASRDAKRDPLVEIDAVVAWGGQILHASIAPVRCPRDSRDENRSGKTGEVPLND